MELLGIYLALIAVAALTGWAAHAAWARGWRGAVWAVLALVLAAVGLCWYLAATATGHYLAGLVEALLAIALLAGPVAGIVLGIVAANWRRIGLALAGLHGLGLGLLMSGLA